jgi:hypothetical protein
MRRDRKKLIEILSNSLQWDKLINAPFANNGYYKHLKKEYIEWATKQVDKEWPLLSEPYLVTEVENLDGLSLKEFWKREAENEVRQKLETETRAQAAKERAIAILLGINKK